ncbi:MAG: hypothetical protein WDN24_03240 [Sphingomonas sp.]
MVQKKSPAGGDIAEPPAADTGTGGESTAKRSTADTIREEASKLGGQAKEKGARPMPPRARTRRPAQSTRSPR